VTIWKSRLSGNAAGDRTVMSVVKNTARVTSVLSIIYTTLRDSAALKLAKTTTNVTLVVVLVIEQQNQTRHLRKFL